MICQNCSSPLGERQAFCDKCGYKTTPDTLASVSDRLARIESRLAASSAGAKEQKYLERETAENVMSRVKTWTGLILFFTGIPAAATLIALAVIFGKADFDLHKIGANAKESVGKVLVNAQTVAASTSKTVNEARTTANQVNQEIRSTQQRVGQLKAEVESRSADLQRLDAKIKDSEVGVATLAAKLQNEEQRVTKLSQEVRTVETQKYAASVKAAFPVLYGQHVVYGREGRIDTSAKVTGESYVSLYVAQDNSKPPSFDPEKLGEMMQSLQAHLYKPFLNGFYLIAETGSSSAGLGGFDPGSCGLPDIRRAGPPCILYFREAMKTKAEELRALVGQIQKIPSERIRYVSPSSLAPYQRELTEKFGLDFVVVVGQE